jgi:DNA-binding transcriptional ArsR family regulator
LVRKPKKLNCEHVRIEPKTVDCDMLVKIVRRLTIEEITARIERFEREFGVRFDDFEESFLDGEIGKVEVGKYFDWAGLVDAYRGYMEGGELDYTVEQIREFDPQEVALLTPKRLELLDELARLQIKSINDLAGKIHRNVKNVYQDLQALKRLGFVTLKKRGKRNIVPKTLLEDITFLI